MAAAAKSQRGIEKKNEEQAATAFIASAASAAAAKSNEVEFITSQFIFSFIHDSCSMYQRTSISWCI